MQRLFVLLCLWAIFVSLSIKANSELNEIIIRSQVTTSAYIEIDYDDDYVIFTECHDERCDELGSVSIETLNAYVATNLEQIQRNKKRMGVLFTLGSAVILAGGVTYYGLDAKALTDYLFVGGSASVVCSIFGGMNTRAMRNSLIADDIQMAMRECRRETVLPATHNAIKYDIITLLEEVN